MYISKLDLNPNRVGFLKHLDSPYRMHAAIEGSFPSVDKHETEQGRVLWRVDALPDGRGIRLYVVSPEKPDLESIARQAGDVESSSWETKDYDRFLAQIKGGQKYHFRLKANPVRKVLQDQGRIPNTEIVGTLQGHITEKHQLQWLFDRMENHGFRILNESHNPEVCVVGSSREVFKRGHDRVTLMTALYEGALEVVDAKTYRHALTFGVGRAKGFGCGLMTIVPMV